MTTLIIKIPTRAVLSFSDQWQLPKLAYIQFNDNGLIQNEGNAIPHLLPLSKKLILLLSASDVLMIEIPAIPLRGQRLRQALPNLVEDQIIPDVQSCHLVIEPDIFKTNKKTSTPLTRRVAVVDKKWLQFLYDTFTKLGYSDIHAVPLSHCFPEGEANTKKNIDILINFNDAQRLANLENDIDDVIELVIKKNELIEGLTIPLSALKSTLLPFDIENKSTRIYQCIQSGYHQKKVINNEKNIVKDSLGLLPHYLTFETLARNALHCRFTLFTAEFSKQRKYLTKKTFKKFRLPIIFIAASVLISIIGINASWLKMVYQRNQLNTEMTDVLLSAFPKTDPVVNPSLQMSQQLDTLRASTGGLSPDDFLALTNILAKSLGPIPSDYIEAMTYEEKKLNVIFKSGTKMDEDFIQRLKQSGLNGQKIRNEKWLITLL